MTSSPGSIPTAPTEAINPDVHELNEIACFTLKRLNTVLKGLQVNVVNAKKNCEIFVEEMENKE